MGQSIPGLDVHWGLVFGLIACIAAYVLSVQRTTFGFGARMVGGNVRGRGWPACRSRRSA